MVWTQYVIRSPGLRLQSPKPIAVFGPLVGVSDLFDLLPTIYQRGYRAASCRVRLVGGSTSGWL